MRRFATVVAVAAAVGVGACAGATQEGPDGPAPVAAAGQPGGEPARGDAALAPVAASDDPDDGAFLQRVAPFTVVDSTGAPVDHPFLGGLDVPRPQLEDIDGDGDLDLFVQERSTWIIFFENEGTPDAPEFVWRTDRFGGLEVGDWNRMVDLDGDGDLDVIGEERFSHIRAYENRGSPARPDFALLQDSLRRPDGTPIFSDRQNIPFMFDLDCNGRLDLFLGRVDGTLTRMEEADVAGPGSNPAPAFALVTDRFEGIEIVAQIGSMHGANSMAFADIDDDGDPDLLWGDFFEPGLLLIENTGSCAYPSFRNEPRPLPAVDTIRSSGYNASVPADIDADGDLELFIGVLGGAFNPARTTIENLRFYERLADGRYELRTARYLSAIDVGSEAVPALADLDGDGDLDLLLGSKADPSNMNSGYLHHFENTGTADAPRFHMRSPLPMSGEFHYAPALGDLNADGRPDLLLGTWRSELQLWLQGGADATDFALADSAVATLPRGSNAVPALADLDGDGDLDLVVGEAAGNLNLFRNEGTARQPRFVLEDEAFAGVDPGRRSAPSFVDVDGDGDLDLVVGSDTGEVQLHRNVGDATRPRFVHDSSWALPLHPYSAPAWGDVDGDGDDDLLAGGRAGGVILLERRAPSGG